MRLGPCYTSYVKAKLIFLSSCFSPIVAATSRGDQPGQQDLRLADRVRLGGVPAEDATELTPACADRDVVSIPSVTDSIKELHFLFFDSASSRSATF